MTTTPPTGHARNIANMDELIAYCIGYGSVFNPSNPNLKVVQLQTTQTANKALLQTVKTTETAYDNACNALEIAMAPLKKNCTRIVNALEATTATKQTINDVKTINHKIQGKPANGTKSKTPPKAVSDAPVVEPSENQISTTQQSIDSMIDNFQKLIVSVTAEPLYIPNENDLKVTALNTNLTALKSLNAAAVNNTIQYSNAMLARDTAFYLSSTNLVDTALEVKKYVKSVFGATSPQFKQISGLVFRKLVRTKK
jgi:hypothetical protein